MKYNPKSLWRALCRMPSPCQRYEALLSLYADQMTTPKQARAVEQHLATCPACRVLLTSFQATSLALAQRATPAPPADLSARLRLAIASERERERARTLAPRPAIRRLALASSLAAAVLAAGIFYMAHPGALQQGPSPGQTAQAPKANNALHVAARPTAPTSPGHTAAPAASADSHDKASRIAMLSGESGSRPERASFIPVRRERAPGQTMPRLATYEAPVRTEQIANLPASARPAAKPKSSTMPAIKIAALPILHPAPPAIMAQPAISSPAIREQTIQEANAVVQPHEEAVEESPHAQLVSALKGIANRALAGQRIASVAITTVQRRDYSGVPLPITGSSIR